jgi:hypothetical protein
MAPADWVVVVAVLLLLLLYRALSMVQHSMVL